MEKVMLSAEVPVEMDEKLKAMAAESDITKSQLIRRLFRQAIEKYEMDQQWKKTIQQPASLRATR